MEDLRRDVLRVLPDIRRFAISLTGNTADGDDLLQTTVEQVLLKGVANDVDIKRWMFRVAKNKWIDEMRAKKVRQNAAQNEFVVMEDKVDTEAQLLSRITLAAVIEKIQALPEDQRAVISLVTLEGYSYRAVSELLDIPMGTVMSRLSRARRTLSDELEDGASDNIVPLKIKKPRT
jgi:RNA polymerase sigma-70 factor (ECF subfamily)